MDAVSAKSRTSGLTTKELKNVAFARETYKDTAPSEAVLTRRKNAAEKAFLAWKADPHNELLRDKYNELKKKQTEQDQVLIGMTAMYKETAPLDTGIGASKRKRAHSANWATWNKEVRIEGSATQVMYFDSNAYKRLSKARKTNTPYAGAQLRFVQGYHSLQRGLQSGLVLTASKSMPPHHKFPHVPYRTDVVCRTPKGVNLCCGQQMLTHGTGHTLEELGIEQVHFNTYLSFKELNTMLRQAEEMRCCFSLISPELGTLDVFRARTGIFAVHCYHFDREDILDIDSNTVRTCKLQGLEPITHFILVNTDTNVIFLAPEVVMMSVQERSSSQSCCLRACESPRSSSSSTPPALPRRTSGS